MRLDQPSPEHLTRRIHRLSWLLLHDTAYHQHRRVLNGLLFRARFPDSRFTYFVTTGVATFGLITVGALSPRLYDVIFRLLFVSSLLLAIALVLWRPPISSRALSLHFPLTLGTATLFATIAFVPTDLSHGLMLFAAITYTSILALFLAAYFHLVADIATYWVMP